MRWITRWMMCKIWELKKTPCIILKSTVHNFENFSHKPTIPSLLWWLVVFQCIIVNIVDTYLYKHCVRSFLHGLNKSIVQGFCCFLFCYRTTVSENGWDIAQYRVRHSSEIIFPANHLCLCAKFQFISELQSSYNQ